MSAQQLLAVLPMAVLAGSILAPADPFQVKDLSPLDFTPAGQSPLGGAATGLDNPSDRTEWISSDDEIQGVAHDPKNWYISNTKSITRIPLTVDLNNIPKGLPTYRIPRDLASRYNHVGDPDYSNGLLYVPLEGGEPLVEVVDPLTMTERGRTVLSPRGDTAEIPWVAINPLDSKLVTSTFNISSAPTQQLRVYSLDASSQAKLDHTVLLVAPNGGIPAVGVSHVQGGAFSKQGHLYLISDADDHGNPACNDPQANVMSLSCHGIYAFGVEESVSAGGPANAYGVPVMMRRFLFFTPVARKTSRVNLLFTHIDTSQELEGMDIFDLQPGVAPGISGMVHIMMSHADSGIQHSFWFKHFDVSNPLARDWL